jgi:tetratricopeptide (TPR) repeat protein
MYALRPRWGGSYGEMEAFLAHGKRHLTASELKVLESIIQFDKGRAKESEGDIDAAISHYTHAAQLVGDLELYVEGLYALTALVRVRVNRDEYIEALPAMNRLLRTRSEADKNQNQSRICLLQDGTACDALDYLVAAELATLGLNTGWNIQKGNRHAREP